jgi:hypothetical protein
MIECTVCGGSGTVAAGSAGTRMCPSCRGITHETEEIFTPAFEAWDEIARGLKAIEKEKETARQRTCEGCQGSGFAFAMGVYHVCPVCGNPEGKASQF